MGIRLWTLRGESAVVETPPDVSAAVIDPVTAVDPGQPTLPGTGVTTDPAQVSATDATRSTEVRQSPPQLQDWEKQEVSRFLQAESAPATNDESQSAETGATLPDSTPAETSVEPAVLPELRNWDATVAAIHACQACDLAQNCTQKVPGVGDRQADLLIVGEGPGHDEDIRGEPFVGRSGQLLDRMLAAIGIDREQVYITNIVKCRPPNNRDPRPEEAARCRHYLEAQIRQLEPKVILSVGRVSAHNLLATGDPVGKLIRQSHKLPGTDIPVKVTYHPAYLLRNPSAKAIAWQDLKQLRRMLS